MISLDSQRVVDAALRTANGDRGPLEQRPKTSSGFAESAVNALARSNGLIESMALRSPEGPTALELPRALPDLKAANAYGVVDISDAFRGQFAGLVVETWNNRPGQKPKHVIVDCAGVTDFAERGDATNALRAELAPPNTLVIKLTQPLQGANIVLEREAGLGPADRRVSPELIGAALAHGVEKLLREQLGDNGPSLLDRIKPPVHLSGLSYAALPLLSIAAQHNVGRLALFEPHVPSVALGTARHAELFQQLDGVPELMSGGRVWANATKLSPQVRGAMWTALNGYGNAPGRVMEKAFGPFVRAALVGAGADPKIAAMIASFSHLRLDPYMPLMTATMAERFRAPEWVKAEGLEEHYAAGIAARVAGAFPEEFTLENMLRRLPEDVAQRTQVVLKAGSAAAQTVEEKGFSEKLPGLRFKTVLSPRHDVYTTDPALAAFESVHALFPAQSAKITERYLGRLQEHTQGFPAAAAAVAMFEQRLKLELPEDEKNGFVLFAGRILAERQFAAENSLSLDDVEDKQAFMAKALFPLLRTFTDPSGEPRASEKDAVAIAMAAVKSQVR